MTKHNVELLVEAVELLIKPMTHIQVFQPSNFAQQQRSMEMGRQHPQHPQQSRPFYRPSHGDMFGNGGSINEINKCPQPISDFFFTTGSLNDSNNRPSQPLPYVITNMYDRPAIRQAISDIVEAETTELLASGKMGVVFAAYIYRYHGVKLTLQCTVKEMMNCCSTMLIRDAVNAGMVSFDPEEICYTVAQVSVLGHTSPLLDALCVVLMSTIADKYKYIITRCRQSIDNVPIFSAPQTKGQIYRLIKVSRGTMEQHAIDQTEFDTFNGDDNVYIMLEDF